ncbi:hypothetical protein ACFY2H_36575 [Streptomyces griseofuscus]|uniref:hypothetical protein n=1 Tax=Streptomyces TaxID=1883 RepID=UPI001601E2F5|nr:hypothetical protein [Streptomyces murinus]MBA9050339.1 hypothetical protein [Streptomyces murinus]
MQRISVKLRERGVPVSPAALSYWQRGSNRPERASSLRAVRMLEEILGQPADSLVALLGPRRPRGLRGPQAGPLSTRELWHDAADLDTALELLEPDAQQLLWAVSNVYAHVQETIGADRSSRGLRVRRVVRAEHDGVDRVLAVLHTDSPQSAVSAVRPSRTGRVRRGGRSGYTVVEIILDRVLSEGDTTTVEYLSEPSDTCLETYTRHALYRPTPVLVVETLFDPEALPVRCQGFHSARLGAPEQTLGPLWLGSGGRAHLALTDVESGNYGIRWDWD